MAKNEPPIWLTSRASDAHKGDFGRVLLVGGSRGMSGSIALSSMAALKTGSGLVSAAVPDRCLETVASFNPCLMTIPLSDDEVGRFSPDVAIEFPDHLQGNDAVGCGPGMTTADGSIDIVRQLLATDIPRVLDADAINVLAKLNWQLTCQQRDPATSPLILTPHPGELQRLVDVSAKDRPAQLDAAQELAAAAGVVIVVKGGPTVVVSPEERSTNSTGNPGMATGGTGDVLTGILTSLLGQGLSSWDAARLGVWLHGRAGDLAASRYGQAGISALEVLNDIPAAMADVVCPTKDPDSRS